MLLGPSGCGKTTLLRMIARLSNAGTWQFALAILPDNMQRIFVDIEAVTRTDEIGGNHINTLGDALVFCPLQHQFVLSRKTHGEPQISSDVGQDIGVALQFQRHTRFALVKFLPGDSYQPVMTATAATPIKISLPVTCSSTAGMHVRRTDHVDPPNAGGRFRVTGPLTRITSAPASRAARATA